MLSRKTGLGLLTALVLALTSYTMTRPELLSQVSFSRAIYDRNGKLLRLTLSNDEKYRLYLPLSDIAPELQESVLLYEDHLFRWHPGVNPIALARAVKSTYCFSASGRGKRMGGSTITMQVARLRYHLNSKSITGKIKQIIYALNIEAHYSKREILEAYFNLVPYGENIEGAGAASLIYFQKDASRLTLAEALSLAVIPQNPTKKKSNHQLLEKSRNILYTRWIRSHPSDSDKKSQFDIPLRLSSGIHLPFQAPHFTDDILKSENSIGRIVTTLDLPTQSLIERLVHGYIQVARTAGIKNAAVLLLDNSQMEIRAMIGSENYLDPSIQGQVNGTQAKRSPGSALKPFVYGLALDQGLIHPMSMLKDVPMSFGGFNPENFDNDFVGPLTATEALILSRNLPAVALSSQLKKPTLYEFLKNAGIAQLRSPEIYGLGLALGGAEVTMTELVSLYSALANGGIQRNIRDRFDQPRLSGKTLLSPQSSYLVLDMLSTNPRPDQGYNSKWVSRPVNVAWKTGTSYGFRDAWAVGVFGHYTLAVWIGNFEGQGNPAFVGRDAAGPLFFRIVDALAAREGLEDFHDHPAPGLTRVKVCSISGKLPGPHCQHTVETWFIPGKSPIHACDIHREVLLSKRTGKRICPGTDLKTDPGPGNPQIEAKVFEFWPSDILRLYKLAGIPRKLPPPYESNCSLEADSRQGHPPLITSPKQGVQYLIRAEMEEQSRISLSAVSDADARELFWFANEALIGKVARNDSLLWKPAPGKYRLRVVDDNGRSNSREITVTLVR